MAIAPGAKLITAEEYLLLADTDQPTELVRGVVVAMNPPFFRHGEICNLLGQYLGIFARENRLGRVLSNDAGVITSRGPDTVRGPDLAYYSFARVPHRPRPEGYAPQPPELVFEVLSPGNTRWEVVRKIGEYLNVGVNVVCIVDSRTETIDLHYLDAPPRVLHGQDVLTFDELPGFRLETRTLFE